MQTHNVQPKTHFRTSRRIGRGGKRGTTAGRGTKGQKARAGHKIRPAMRDIMKKLPKQRGRGKHTFKSFQARSAIVSVRTLNSHFKEGETVDPRTLVARGLVARIKGRIPEVKILGGEELKKKLIFKDVSFSRPAKISTGQK